MPEFKLVSEYSPTGDQPTAIKNLVEGMKSRKKFQTLLGATGTGKTFTVANIIQEVQMPTLVMAPNKTLAAQLYNELKELFPENAVHYFVSYYDYYQPEAFLPTSGQYIEKDFSVNFEIQRHRLATAHALRTRVDAIVVATVSCIYGMGNPKDWEDASIVLEVGSEVKRSTILRKLIEMGYERKEMEIRPGIVRAKGDILDIYPLYLETALRISLFGDEIESIEEIHPITMNTIQKLNHCRIFPSTEFVIPEENKVSAIEKIEQEMIERVAYFKKHKKYAEAQRIESRTKFDLEMLREMGFCKAIENYSRFLDDRDPGVPPRTIIDYFPKNLLIIVDESHITIPQIHGMIRGDISRKDNLIEYGYRLPSAYDNRPLKFKEWEGKINKIICMSATPGNYELEKSGNEVAEQIIRPTGLVDPVVEVRPIKNQIDDLLGEIKNVVAKGERVLITTLTKRMSEDIADYYNELGVKVTYLHSEIDTVERFDILRNLREGVFDVLVGINLLREGLDLPEVSLVAILDADKEGFLRDTRSLIQTIGRASRNINGRAILYADTTTRSMKAAIDETNRRRKKQLEFNEENNITPKTIQKKILESLAEEQEIKDRESRKLKNKIEEQVGVSIDVLGLLKYLESEMYRAANDLRFEDAAYLRDKIKKIKIENHIT
jgi:excinuclease ABC subunit B